MRALRYHKLLIFLIVGGFVAAAFAFAFAQPPTYRATSEVVVQPVLQPPTSTSPFGVVAGDPALQADIETEAQIAGSALVASMVLRHLPDDAAGAPDVPSTPDGLADAIETKAVTDDLLEITASASTPRVSALIANAVAEQYLARRTDAAARTREALIDGLRGRIARLERAIERLDQRIIKIATRPVQTATVPVVTSSPAPLALSAAERKAELDQLREERDQSIVQLGTLRARYQDLLAIPAGSIGGGQVVQRAVAPEAPAFPQPIRIAAVALMIGAIVAVAVALLVERTRDRVRTRDDAANAAGAPVVAAVVGRPSRRRRGRLSVDKDPTGREAQAFRTLRTKLVARGLGSEVRSLLVAPVEGGTVDRVVAEVAATVAAIGKRVLAFSAFVRGSRLASFFPDGFDRVPPEASLSSVMTGEVRWPDAVVRTGRQNLLLLRSGPPDSWTPDLLGSERFARLMDEAESTADVVVIESPPLATGSDATSVAIRADAALLVIRAGRDRKASLARASAALRQTGCVPIGVLLMRCSRGDRTVGVPITLAPDWPLHASNGTRAGRHGNGNGNGNEPRRSDGVIAATGDRVTRGDDA
jgi:Mrp family chromosome partitioning ATPase/capsular polysaccharide biosynthesis protein